LRAQPSRQIRAASIGPPEFQVRASAAPFAEI
jgi:hypothetical protein